LIRLGVLARQPVHDRLCPVVGQPGDDLLGGAEHQGVRQDLALGVQIRQTRDEAAGQQQHPDHRGERAGRHLEHGKGHRDGVRGRAATEVTDGHERSEAAADRAQAGDDQHVA